MTRVVGFGKGRRGGPAQPHVEALQRKTGSGRQVREVRNRTIDWMVLISTRGATGGKGPEEFALPRFLSGAQSSRRA